MIKLKNVSIKYIKDYYSLYNVNLEINGNTLLIGNETSGNNFLLRLIAKIDKDYEGEIFVDNENLKQIKDKDLNLAYIPKTPYLFENKTLLENLIYPLKIRKISKIEAILRAKTAIKPYFFKIFEIFNKTKAKKDKLNNNLNDIDYSKSYNDENNKFKFKKEKFESDFESNKTDDINLIQNNKQSNENLNSNIIALHLTNEEFENYFESFLNTKIKKLDLSTKKIITLLRAKIRAPKYILIENFFENLDENFLNLANEIILDLKTTSTIIASQNDEKFIPAYENFEQIFFDAGSVKKDD